MFEKLRDKPLASSQERFETLIGRTTQIYGRLVLVDSVRIDGKVVGNIETSKENKVTVAIGASGEVSGDVTAHRVMVAGKVEGNIYATERVEFHKDSVVHGDISYGSIAVEQRCALAGLVIQNPAGGNNAGDAANSAIRQAQTSSKPPKLGSDSKKIGVRFQLIHACLPTTVGSSAAHRSGAATFATRADPLCSAS